MWFQKIANREKYPKITSVASMHHFVRRLNPNFGDFLAKKEIVGV